MTFLPTHIHLSGNENLLDIEYMPSTMLDTRHFISFVSYYHLMIEVLLPPLF